MRENMQNMRNMLRSHDRYKPVSLTINAHQKHTQAQCCHITRPSVRPPRVAQL